MCERELLRTSCGLRKGVESHTEVTAILITSKLEHTRYRMIVL